MTSWVRDSDVLEVDADERKRQKESRREAFLDLKGCQFVYNSFQAWCEALAEFSLKPVAKDSDVMMDLGSDC